VVLLCAAFAREQRRRTTGRQGVDVRRAQRRALTPEAWRDLSASDDETSEPVASMAPANVQIPTAHWCACSGAGNTGIGPTRRCIPVLLRELGSLLFAVLRRALLHDLS
jgi:hypothetical protein